VDVRLVTIPEHECNYLPGRQSQTRAFWASRIAPDIYHDFMDAGFRRSGSILYQPICRGCRACLPLRVPISQFRPNKSQRRCWRRNQDLQVHYGRPVATDEKYALYTRYLTQWHTTSAMTDDRESFEQFLYDSPVESLEFEYRAPEGNLLAVGICDLCAPRSLSSVYFYFDPSHARRGLGTFGALREIEFARRAGIVYYYMGFWVAGCRSMQYKTDYRPCEILHPEGVWKEFQEVSSGKEAST
jgi:arginine-tRNA-protein transferase